eukprot:scaffold108568_cov57-Phaeocystis_antarctica.AAC.1
MRLRLDYTPSKVAGARGVPLGAGSDAAASGRAARRGRSADERCAAAAVRAAGAGAHAAPQRPAARMQAAGACVPPARDARLHPARAPPGCKPHGARTPDQQKAAGRHCSAAHTFGPRLGQCSDLRRRRVALDLLLVRHTPNPNPYPNPNLLLVRHTPNPNPILTLTLTLTCSSCATHTPLAPQG